MSICTARFSSTAILLYVLMSLAQLDRSWCNRRTNINFSRELLAHTVIDFRRLLYSTPSSSLVQPGFHSSWNSLVEYGDFSPADRTDTAGGTRTPREPPGRRGESGEGKPLPRVPNPPAAPVSCVQAAPPAGCEPLTDPAGTVRGVVPLHSSPERHRDRVPDRPFHAAEAD